MNWKDKENENFERKIIGKEKLHLSHLYSEIRYLTDNQGRDKYSSST